MAFVSYDSYKNRIEKLAKFKNFVEKYKFLIMGVLAVILGGASALMATKGMITSDITLSADTYVYGAPYTPTAGTAFLSDVGYEYSVQGSNEWTDVKPVKVGKYSVRAVSNKLVGKGYGTPVDFEILPKEVEFSFGKDETTLIYGNKPQKYGISELVLSDRIDVNGANFTYEYNDGAEDYNEWTVDVTVAAGSVKIVDKNGNDSSDCYIYDTKKQTFALARRNIDVVLQNANETYRGTEISYKGELFKPNLAEGDSIAFETEITQNGSPAKLLNAGEYGIKVVDGSVKISDGVKDVTHRYDYGTPVNGKFTVNRRPLTITTADGNKVYDGTALSNEVATPDNLVLGHTLSPVGAAPSITDAGTKLNEREFIILDANGDPVSTNYDYKYKYGYLTVTRRPLTITTDGGEWEYDGTPHPVTEYDASGLAENQVLVVGPYYSENAINVWDSGENSVEYYIQWQSGGTVYSDNYSVTTNYGDIKITARPLKVVTGGNSRDYNGTALKVGTYEVTYAGEKPNQTSAFIKPNEDLSIVGSLPYIINVGTKENAINFAVPNGNYYVKETVNGTLTVTQAEITVSLDNASCKYGDKLPAPDITISGSGIVGGNLFGGDTFTPAFKYLKNGVTPATYEADNTYDIVLDTVNSSFTYGNSEPVSESNYKINSDTSTLTVGKRTITVYLNDTTRIYGDELIYDVGGERVEGIVSGQTVQVNSSQVVFGTSTMPDKGTYAGKISCPTTAITVLSGTTPVTSNYDVKVAVSTLYISKRPITVHANDILGVIYGFTPEYEEKPDNYKEITDGSLATGETLTITRVAYLSGNSEINPSNAPNVGTYKIKPSSVKITKSNGDSSTDNYQITPADDGVFTIVERPITIQSATDLELIYDGTPQPKKSSYEVTSELDILSGHTIEVTYYKTVTDASAVPVENELECEIKDLSGDVTKNYDITYVYGYLKVNPKPITVQLYTSDTYSAVYGESYAYPTGAGNYKNTPDLVSGETLEITKVTYEFGYVATPNVRDTAYWVKEDAFKVTKSNGAVGTDNYEVEWVDGSLKINPRHIRVTLKSDSVYYGSRGAYDVSNAGNYARATLLDLPSGNALVSGEQLKITAVTYEYGAEQYPEVKEGGYWIHQAGYEITKGGVNSKDNYAVEWEDGTLTILPRTVEVALNDIVNVTYGKEVEYAGGYKSKSGVLNIHTVTVNAATGDMSFTPDSDNATYVYPDAGTYKFTCDESFISITDGSGKDVKYNYTVNVAKGNLEIDKREITVKPHSYEKVYGEIYNYSTVTLTPNYEKLTKGSLAVFDGEEETLVIFVDSLEVDGYVKKDVDKYTFTPNRYTVTRYDGHDSTNNYDVKFENGTLEIKPIQIAVELKDIILTYGEDGHTGKNYAQLYADKIDEVEITPAEKLKLTFGFTDEYGNPVKPHDAGDYKVVITNGKTKNYEVVANGTGSLTINPRQIQPIPYSQTAVYGTTEFKYQSGKSNFDIAYPEYWYCLPAYDEEIEILVSYNIDKTVPPSVGKYPAYMTGVRIHYANGTSEFVDEVSTEGSASYSFRTTNYYISNYYDDFKEKLVITPKTLTVILSDITAHYGDTIKYVSDGTENDKAVGLLTEFGHTLNIDPDGITFAQNGKPVTPENVGTYDIVTSDTDFITISSGDGDVTKNYDIKVTKGGTLTITAREITLIFEDLGDIVYGTAAPVPKITGTVNEDKVSGKFKYYNKSTSGYFDSEWLNGGANRYLTAGTYEVTLDKDSIVFEYTNDAPATTKNYVITAQIPANLIVKQRQITVTLQDFERVYGQNNSAALTWQKNGNNNGLSYISDMDIDDLISIESLAPGDGVYSLTLSVYAKDTTDGVVCKDAGKYSVGLSALVFHYDGGSSQATQNYEYTLPATVDFEITKYELKLEVGEKRALYGGESVILDYWSYRQSTGLPFSEVVTVSGFALDGVTEHPADASTTPYALASKTYTAKVEGGSADNYEITIEGTLKIEPRELTIYLHDSRVYYGEAYEYLDKWGGTYRYDIGLITVDDKKETLEITLVDYGFKGVRPNASTTPYTVQKAECKITKVDGATPSTGNYNITYMDGDLTVDKRPVTVTLQLVEDTIYYGENLPAPEYEVEGSGVEGGLVGSDKFNPVYVWRESGSPKYYDYAYEPILGNVGVYGIILYQAQSHFTDADDNVVQNYEIVSNSLENEVTLNITPRPIKVELKDITVEYGIFDSSDAFFVDDDIKEILKIIGDYDLAFKETFTYAKIQTVQDSDDLPIMKNKGSYDVELIGLNVLRGDSNIDFIYGTNSNYELTEDSVLTATVTINPKVIKDLNLGIYSFTYGEEEKFREEFTYKAKAPVLAFDETLTLKTFYAVEDGNPITDRLDAGKYTISADQASADFSDANGQTNYEITFTGTLTVFARPVKVELLDFYDFADEYFYGDGENLVYPEYKGNYQSLIYAPIIIINRESKEGLVYGQQLQIAIRWKCSGKDVDAPRNVGTYDYQIDETVSVLYDEDGNEISGIDNYSFESGGKVRIEKLEVEFFTIQEEKVYDGKPFEYPTEYGNYTLRYPETQKLPYNEQIKIAVRFYDGQWHDAPIETGVYTISYKKGSAVILVGDNHDAVIENYDLYDCGGWLIISQRPITVNTVKLDDVFYGERVRYPADLDDYCVVDGDGLAEGQHISITSVEYYDENGKLVDGVPTAVGTYYVVPTAVAIYYDNGKSVDLDNYDISYPDVPADLSTCGTVKIMPISLHLKTNDHTWEYDGTPHSDTGYTLYLIDDKGNVTDKEFKLPEDEAKLVEVEEGYTTVKNACTNVLNVVSYDFSKTNYEIVGDVEPGLLTVTKLAITIKSATNHTFVYNGDAHSDSRYEVTSENKLIAWHEIVVSNPTEITFVTEGVVNNEQTYNIIDTKVAEGDEDRDVTENYIINEVPVFGTLKVIERAIKVQSNGNSWIYDGTHRHDDGFTQLFDEGFYTLVDGHEIKVTYYPEVRTVMEGKVDNNLDYAIVDEYGNDFTLNYYIEKVVGKLEITPVEITLVLSDRVVTYGDELYINELNNYDVNNSTPLVGSEQLQVAVKYKDEHGKILAVDPVDVGDYTIVLDLAGCYVETEYGENGFGNYTVLNPEVTAQLTIIPREITVQLDPITKQYGEAFDGSDAGYRLVSGEIVNEDDIKVTVYCPDGDIDERTVVGEYTLAIESCSVNGVHNVTINDVPNLIHAGNYDITYVESKLNVIKRKIVAVAASAQKEGYYDGTPFSCTDYAGAYSEDYEYGIMPWDDIDEVLEYDNGANSVINAGTWDNDAQFKSKSANYEVVRTVKGELTILKRPVTIILLEVEGQTYGTPLSYPDGTGGLNYGYAEDSLEIVEGEKLVIAVTFYGSDGSEADPKNADTYSYAWNKDGSIVEDSIGGAGIDNYAITCVGTTEYEYSAEVEKLEVSLTLQGWDDIDYDGYEHEYDGGIDYEFPYDETMVLGVDYYSVVDEVKTLMVGLPKNAGNYAVRYVESKTTIGGVAANINYVINISPDGDIPFTINALNITISMDAEEYPYDGTVYVYKDSNDNFEVSASVAGETVVPHVSYYEDEAFTLPATPKNAGTYYVKFKSFTVEGTNDVVENYNLLNTDVWCTLEITPKKIQIQALLDGNDFHSIERFDELPEEGFEHFTFVAEDLAYLTAEYSYGYRGEDGKATSTPVEKEDANKTIGIYELYVSFKESTEGGNVLGNYEITENLPAKLEVTARHVTVEAVYNGEERQYDGEPLKASDFTFIHWHGDNRGVAGFYDDFEAEYELLFSTKADGTEFTTDLPVNAGTYYVKIRVTNADPKEYLVTNSTTPVTVTITKRRLVATANYDADEFKNITYSFDLLPTSITVTNTAENGDIGIIENDVLGGVSIAWYFYNTTISEEVVYNYAGNYQIRFRLVGDDENYEITNPNAGGNFAVNKAVLYVTPNDVIENYYYEGQTLTLGEDDFTIWDMYGDLQSNGDITDVLKITESSGVNRNVRTKKVTITKVKITQDGKDVTSSYEVHFRYETGSYLPASEFEANLTFIPVVIKYKQTSLNGGNPLMLEYTGKTHDLSPYVDKSNLSSYIEILNEGAFLGPCTLTYNLVTIQRWAGDYEKWIQIMVKDSYGVLLNGLYDFRLENANESKVVVYGDYIDFELDAGCDFTDVTASSYKGYDILNSGYTLSGLVDGSHNFEVLTRLENGVRVIKIIIYTNGENGRVDASYRYSISPTSNNPVSVKVTQISQIIASTTIN